MKHLVICGGAHGLGSKIAYYFLKMGWKISILDISENKEMSKAGIRIFPCDLSDYSLTKKAFQSAFENEGKIDVLISSIRLREKNPASREKSWKSSIDVDLNTYFNSTSICCELMQKQREGSIILLSSITSKLVTLFESVGYHAAKAAINQMTKYFAVQYGPDNIRINTLLPGLISNEYAENSSTEPNASLYAKIAQQIPLRRSGSPADLFQLAYFLASDQSSYITGQEFIIDGGLSLLDQGGLLASPLNHTNRKENSFWMKLNKAP